MACTHTWKMKNKNYIGRTGQKKYYLIPCGKCISCMIDKTNDLKIRCEWEMMKYGFNSFVTITYDDSELPINENGINTLRYEDVQKFWKRLRTNIDRLKLNSPTIRRDFKYLIVGEYGDKFKRCHYHALIFGIDFIDGQKLIQESWGKGWVKSLPIKNGGIRYVLKYLEKSLNNKEVMKLYDDEHIERPFQKHSNGLGRGIYENQIEYIKKTSNIKWNLKDVPCNRYYLNKMLVRPKTDNTNIKNEMEKLGIEKEKITIYGIKDYTETQINRQKQIKAHQKEIEITIKNRQNGQPMEDVKMYEEG